MAPRNGPICPRCDRPSHREEVHNPASGATFLRNFCCGLVSWNGHPLREVVGSLQAARAEAHAAFDPLWKTGLLPRSKAYEMLAAELGVSEPQAHMKVMSEQMARRVPHAVLAIRARLGTPVSPSGEWEIPVTSWHRAEPQPGSTEQGVPAIAHENQAAHAAGRTSRLPGHRNGPRWGHRRDGRRTA